MDACRLTEMQRRDEAVIIQLSDLPMLAVPRYLK